MNSHRTISIGAMLRQLAGLVDTKDLSDWENRFVKNVADRTGNGQRTSILTADQVEKVEQIFVKHFSG